jgi:hypothetical protein
MVLAIGVCLALVAIPMAPADQRIAVAKLITAFSLIIAGPVGTTVHENFPRMVAVALFAMGMTIMMDVLTTAGPPYDMKIGEGVLLATSFAGTCIGMAGGMWEACGRGDAA